MRGDAIGLVSEQILLFHTTPTPTGCLLPCYWALQGLDGPGRSLCWTNPGSVNWRAARAGPILGAFIYRLVKARPIVWEFIGNCLDWSGGLDEGRTTSKNLFRRLINGWILPEIFYMKFFKQTVLGGVKYVLKCWSNCKMVQSNLTFLTTFWLSTWNSWKNSVSRTGSNPKGHFISLTLWTVVRSDLRSDQCRFCPNIPDNSAEIINDVRLYQTL